ncbi:hypothetical protein QUA82_16425 [Microcoleus sp. F8-D3]
MLRQTDDALHYINIQFTGTTKSDRLLIKKVKSDRFSTKSAIAHG